MWEELTAIGELDMTGMWMEVVEGDVLVAAGVLIEWEELLTAERSMLEEHQVASAGLLAPSNRVLDAAPEFTSIMVTGLVYLRNLVHTTPSDTLQETAAEVSETTPRGLSCDPL